MLVLVWDVLRSLYFWCYYIKFEEEIRRREKRSLDFWFFMEVWSGGYFTCVFFGWLVGRVGGEIVIEVD